jgi:hypothetical protein
MWLGEDGWDSLLQIVCDEAGPGAQNTQPRSSGGESPSHSPPPSHAVLRLLDNSNEGEPKFVLKVMLVERVGVRWGVARGLRRRRASDDKMSGGGGG